MTTESPSLTLRDSLIASGWTAVQSKQTGAYERTGQRYMTWTKDGVMIASSGTSKYYVAQRNVVEMGDGCGYEVTIEALIVEPKLRGQGQAKLALKAWISLAEKAGVTLYLEPVPLEDGVNRESLIRLYAAVGFIASDSNSRVMQTRSN